MTSILAVGLLSQPLIMGLLILSMIFAMYAQYKVSSAYKKNVRIPSRGRITGREAAEAVMSRAGISDVEITEIGGHLTDHYDPTNKRLVLSSENYRGTSLAALGVSVRPNQKPLRPRTFPTSRNISTPASTICSTRRPETRNW